MISDDERRRAAEGLRFSVGRNPMTMPQAGRSIINAMCPYGFTSWNDILLNLADIIEPTSPTSRHDASDIDREALLALADILDLTRETDCRGCRLEGAGCAECSSGVAHEVARRIREACGEARDE